MEKTILVVDDCPDVCWALLTCLSLDDYQVNLAHDCDNALHTVRSAPPGLILLDYQMAGMPVGEFVERIRAQFGYEVQIVLFTGASNPESLASELRLQHVLRKPVDITALLDVCRSLIDGEAHTHAA